MKFIIEGKILKNIVDRVNAVIGKKSIVKIKAENNKVTFTAATPEKGIVITNEDATVCQEGSAIVGAEDLKNICTFNSMVNVVVEDNKLVLSDNKKVRKIGISDCSEDMLISFDTSGKKEFLTMPSNELIRTLQDLKPFLSKGKTRSILTGYNFDGRNNNIVAISGFHIGMRKNVDFKIETDVTLPCFAADDLKKITNKKSDGNINVDITGKYAIMTCDDYVYTARLLEEKYMGYITFFDNCDSFNFDIVSNELKDITTEYMKYTKLDKNKEEYMFLLYKGKKMATYTKNTSSVMIDCFNVENVYGLENGFAGVFNCNYLNDAMKLFTNDNIVRAKGNYTGVGITKPTKSPIIFEDDDYMALVLPVNPKDSVLPNVVAEVGKYIA